MECEELKKKNRILELKLATPQEIAPRQESIVKSGEFDMSSSPKEKIELFWSLFKGREDVYPTRWDNPRKQTSGYSPVYIKKRGEFVDKEDREYLPVTDNVIEAHLSGEIIMGVYALTLEDKCHFIAADFDKKTWEKDCLAVLESCRTLGIPATLERSRSGNGGHIWIFFSEAVDASLARKLGSLMLTHAMDSRPEMGLDSYDRLFPSQDTLPKGGFGNLIALPLQKKPRKRGGSVFIDLNFEPHPDQWRHLGRVKKLNAYEIESIVSEAAQVGDLLGVRRSYDLQDNQKPWDLKPSEAFCSRPIKGVLPEEIKVTLANLIFIEKVNLPSSLINRIIRIAAFHNPEFYKAQAMRFSTFDKPRLIHCAEGYEKYLALPRGCFKDLKVLCDTHGISINVEDRRNQGSELITSFNGELRDHQEKATKAILKHDTGVVCAATAFGKTVVAANIIAQRKVNTLIIVHRKQLLDQWKERLTTFLDIEVSDIGQIGGGKNKPTGVIDVAIIQSLNRKGVVKDLVGEYGHVIVDECHHISAFSFEQVLRKVKALYVMGLTATPERKDGHHPILFMQCGAIRYKMTAKAQAKLRPFKYIVHVKPTDVRFDNFAPNSSIHELYQTIIGDVSRNRQIVLDAIEAIKEGRSPLVLTERTEHVHLLAKNLRKHVQHLVVLKGGMGVKEHRETTAYLQSIPESETRIIVATGSYIGEGFDDSRLDTLFLAMPVSWKGTLQQYAGRLHRLHEGKTEVRIYDYVDDDSPVFASMFRKRLKGYSDMGYEIYNENQHDLGL